MDLQEMRVAVAYDDAEVVLAKLNAALGIEFESRSSEYWGDYWIDVRHSKLRIFWNRDPLYVAGVDPPEDRFFEARFPNHAVSVDVYESNRESCLQIATLLSDSFPGSATASGPR